MKLLLAILSGFCAVLFAYQWYSGIQIPAWQALIWCLPVFFRDLEDYLDNK